jgi:hypothetical protein
MGLKEQADADLAPVLLAGLAPADPKLTAPVMPKKTAAPPSQFFTTGLSTGLFPTAIMDGTNAILKEIARLRADMHRKP